MAAAHDLFSVLLLLAILSVSICTAQKQTPIKVGVLHSLTGTISGSEIPLRDVILYLIQEQNKKGGLLGRPLVPVVKDPASDWPLFAELARELIVKDKVDIVFGCWTSVSRKSVLSVFEELDHLLIYPVQYEGEECSYNIFYTGAAPNQQAIPAVDFLYSNSSRRFVLVGTDYVYPRTTANILNAYLKQQLNIPPEDVLTVFTPFSHSDWTELVTTMINFYKTGLQQNKSTAIISTINGDANTYFYSEIAAQFATEGLNATLLPIIAFSVGEAELSVLSQSDLELVVGNLAAWNYFMSMNTTNNNKFISGFLSFQDTNNVTEAYRRVVNDPMEAHYIGFNMWAAAVTQAGTTSINAVRQALYYQRVESLSGYTVTMGTNHHLVKPVFIGKANSKGQFDIVSSEPPVPALPWSPSLHFNGDRCDWSYPYVCSKCNTPTYSFSSL